MNIRDLQQYLDQASDFQYQAFSLLNATDQDHSAKQSDLLRQLVHLLTISHASLSAARSILNSEIERQDDEPCT